MNIFYFLEKHFDKLDDDKMNEFTVSADVLTLEEALDTEFNIEQPNNA